MQPKPTGQLKRAVVIPAAALRPGMFVAAVSGGWRSTPFLLEGILVTSDEEILIFQERAATLIIDPCRSRADALDAIPSEELYESRPAAVQDVPGLGAPVHLAPFARLPRVPKNAPRPFVGARPPFLPAHIPLVAHPEPEPLQRSLPRAVAACDFAVDVLQKIASDITSHGITDGVKLQQATQMLAQSMISHPHTMIWAARLRERSDAMYQRGLEVAIYLTALGRQLGFPEDLLAELAAVGLLLDLGKTELDPALLAKPGRYDDMERKRVQAHVELSIRMLQRIGPASDLVRCAIAEHHERIDGNGYPRGLCGTDISIFGKMAAVADSYAAMVNPRPYAPVLSPHQAVRQLFAGADGQWFPPLVEQFVQSIGIFPVGSLVELSTGEVAVVTQHSRIKRLEPKVLVLTGPDKQKLEQPRELDLLAYNIAHRAQRLRILKGLPEGLHALDFRELYLKSTAC